MEHSTAVPRDRLIPSELSHALLRRSIGLGSGGRRRREAMTIDPQAIARLRELYARFAAPAAAVPNAPRNLPFYLALRERYPDIGWTAPGDPREAAPLEHLLELPQLAGVDPSLAALLLQDLPAAALSIGPPLPPELRQLPAAVLADVQALFDDARVVRRRGEAIRDFARVVARGLAGESVQLLCPVCPDYAHEPTGRPQTPYRYTFAGIGTEPGLVAERLLEDLPRFMAFFERHGIAAQALIAQADFEVLSPATLQQVGVDAATFLQRMAAGRRRIAARCAGRTGLRSGVVSALCEDGLAGWQRLHGAMRRRLDAVWRGEATPAAPIDWQAILAARSPLYERWFGPAGDGTAHRDVLIRQGAEYAALAALAHELAPNAMLLCCDHHVMTPFYKVEHDVPVVYLKRNYA